jgi:hypothetical protein
MKPPRPRTLALLAVAAELRACGASWAAVGQKVERDPDTCREWPNLYPAEWDRFYRKAARQFTKQLRAEAKAVLQSLLRSKDEKVRLSAVDRTFKIKDLPEMPRERPGRPADQDPRDREVRECFEYVKSLSDAEVKRVVEECRARSAAAAGGGGGGTGAANPPGPAEPG